MQIEEFRPNLPSAESQITVHGVPFAQIRAYADLVGKGIRVYGGMAPGLPLATIQSRKAGLLMEGRIIRCWGNWIGTEMSVGMSFVPAGIAEAGEGGGGGGEGGGGGGGGGGGNGGGGGGAGGQSAQVSMRVQRTGFRSIDSKPFSRGQVRAIDDFGPIQVLRRGPVVGATEMVATPYDIGIFGGLDATSIAGGIANSLFGGGFSGLQAPLNMIHNMMPNMPMSGAISETLSKAFPHGSPNVNISSALKLPYQDAGMYQNIQQYSSYINKISQGILGIKNYLGVQFSSHDNTINVWDGTSPIGGGGTVEISALELIGQPTWILPKTISIKTVMRADIWCGMYITLPPTLVGVTSDAVIPGGAASEQRSVTSFSGTFLVTRVLHLGDYRNPDGAGWSTNYEAVVQDATTGQVNTAAAVDTSNQNQNPDNKPPGDGTVPETP
jgi:hypothetical protein